MKTLHLTLKKKWFDMILSGEKKEEYREIKEYWTNRLFEKEKFDVISFRNGYATNAPTMIIECLGITTGIPKVKWCDLDFPEEVIIIKLGKIIETKNLK